jgi:hypothetical protein
MREKIFDRLKKIATILLAVFFAGTLTAVAASASGSCDGVGFDGVGLGCGVDGVGFDGVGCGCDGLGCDRDKCWGNDCRECKDKRDKDRDHRDKDRDHRDKNRDHRDKNRDHRDRD